MAINATCQLLKRAYSSLVLRRGDPLPVLGAIERSSGLSMAHVSAFTYGNFGDAVLPVCVRRSFEKHAGTIRWKHVPVWPEVTPKTVRRLNSSGGVLVGGGGLFLKDTNQNDVSGWQWPCSLDALSRLRVPLALFAVGYNRFRGQADFADVFRSNLIGIASHSVYIGMRNSGSVQAMQNLVGDELREKIRYQPCPTTIFSQLFPELMRNSDRRYIGVNLAFDRSGLRFSGNIMEFLRKFIDVLKCLNKDFELRYYSHMPSDESVLPLFEGSGIVFDVKRLYSMPIKDAMDAYQDALMVIGMRGHAQMIPFGCETPIISLVSHDKMNWFLADVGMTEYGVEINDPELAEKVLSLCHKIADNRSDIVREIRFQQEKLARLTDKNVDDFVLSLAKVRT